MTQLTNMILPVITFLLSFLLVAQMLPRVLILSLRKRLFDPIDPRKVHSVPASRLGGVTFFPSILFSVWFTIAMTNVYFPWLGYHVTIDISMILQSLAFLTLFMVGVYDDVVGVSYSSKFCVQIFAALFIVMSGVYFKTFHGFLGIDDIPRYIGVPMTLMFIVYVINAINLVDGIDGLASMLSMMALIVYGTLLYSNGELLDSLFAFATFGALAPFFYCNVFGVKQSLHSKIFMGDTGSLVVGAILSLLAVMTWNMEFNEHTLQPISSRYYILAFTMLLIPCFDVIRVALSRLMRKRALFLPDKNHIHHRFIALGISHHKALLCIVAMSFSFVVINFGLSFILNFTYIFIIDILLWAGVHICISTIINRRKEQAN